MTELLTTLNWPKVALMTGGILVAIIFFFRTERRYRLVSLFILLLPTCGLMYLYARWTMGQTTEMWVALILAIILYRVWHRLIGQHLPEQDSADIKVWGQDD